MSSLLWSGKLSLSMKILVNTNIIMAWFTGSSRDIAAMKNRMKMGYDAKFTDTVARYDELGVDHYTKIAKALLEEIDTQNKDFIDIGCGTGILSLLALERGVNYLTCGDQSSFMLKQCQSKMISEGYTDDMVKAIELDAESIPLEDGSFDIAASSMVIGLVPNQEQVLREMARITRSKGIVAIATHAPQHNYEAIDNTLKMVPKRYTLGYRIEYWPRSKEDIQMLMRKVGLQGIHTRRLTWRDSYPTGGEVYDFFAATSSSWWFEKYPENRREEMSNKTREYFERKKIRYLTQDVILAYGTKP